MAHENIDAELVLKTLDLFADTRLRGEQDFGSLGKVQILARNLADIAQLLQFHRCVANVVWLFEFYCLFRFV